MKKAVLFLVLIMIVAMTVMPIIAYAGGDKNTNRGSVGEQIGDPEPDPEEDPSQPRIGDPNPDMDNIPLKDGD